MIKPSWAGNSKNIYFLPQQNQCCETNTDLKSQVFSPGDHRLHWEQAESCLLKCSGIAPRYQEMINALGCHQRSKKSRNTHNFLSTWKSQLRFSKGKDHCSRSKKYLWGKKEKKKFLSQPKNNLFSRQGLLTTMLPRVPATHLLQFPKQLGLQALQVHATGT